MTRRHHHWLYAAVWSTAAFLCLSLAVNALWIPAKAELAQWLMQHSWRAILAGDSEARPWPWADTRPVAVLSVPGLGVRQFILEGSSGRNLAFGPVLLHGSSGGRDLVISGHRDTHFSFLRQLAAGDLLRIESIEGTLDFRVAHTDIIDSRQQQMVIEPGVRRISLVTCYPFDAMQAGGPLRYVVTALPVQPVAVTNRGLSRQPVRASG